MKKQLPPRATIDRGSRRATMPHEPPVDTSSLPRVHEDGSLLGQSLGAFLRALEGKNRSSATIRAYRSDVSQFLTWLHENNALARTPGNVAKADVGEYLAELAQQEVSGVSRARKLAALREYFRFLVGTDVLARSPIEGFETPKKEKNGRVFLRTEEYTRMLSAAGGNPRDYAMLQVFLQTGLRVSELCNLRLDDVDFGGRTLRITAGKGMVAREVELEKKGILAIKSYLAVRPQVLDDRLFLNRDGEPIGERGVRKLVVKYRDKAGITKKASCHSLRHTFATYKAEKGVSPFQLQQWLGHASLNTTQIYVHLGRQNAKKVMEATSL